MAVMSKGLPRKRSFMTKVELKPRGARAKECIITGKRVRGYRKWTPPDTLMN